MPSYHVHVYLPMTMVEVNVEAANKTEALDEAIRQASHKILQERFVTSDCKFLAVAFQQEDDETARSIDPLDKY